MLSTPFGHVLKLNQAGTFGVPPECSSQPDQLELTLPFKRREHGRDEVLALCPSYCNKRFAASPLFKSRI
jgi:hypothetical protein